MCVRERERCALSNVRGFSLSWATSFPVCSKPLSPCHHPCHSPHGRATADTQSQTPSFESYTHTHTQRRNPLPPPRSPLNSSHLLPCHNYNSQCRYHCYCSPGILGPRRGGRVGRSGGVSGVKFICSAPHREPVTERRRGITLTAWVKTCVPLFYLLFHLCRTKSNSPPAAIKLMRRPSGDAYAAVLCLVVHRRGKVLFVCGQSFAPERLSHRSR